MSNNIIYKEINAAEALELMQKYQKHQTKIQNILAIIFNQIKLAASMGESHLYVDRDYHEISLSEKNEIIAKLQDLGFYIDHISDFTILWTKRKCTNKNSVGQCIMHNLQCAYPKCENIFQETKND